MVGRPAAAAAKRRTFDAAGGAALSIESLRVDMPGEPVHDVSLTVRRGEILGIGGLAGQGKLGIANGIMGLYHASGEVLLHGEPFPLNEPRKALERGLAFVSEDRRGVGLLGEESVELNMALAALEAQGRFLRPFPIPALRPLDQKALRRHAINMIARLDIRTQGPAQQVRRLSGGNQQKVGLARLLIAAFLLGLFAVAVATHMDLRTLISDSITRVARNGILVLALLPAVQGGLGLNFGLPLGIICGLIGCVVSLNAGVMGVTGLAYATGIGLLLAIPAGVAHGWPLNRTRGQELMGRA